MAEKPKNKSGQAQGAAEGPFTQKDRGTTDDLEILREIVANTAAVRTQVLVRLREAKARIEKKNGG